MLVNKPVGLVVHCDSRQIPDTLINRVLHYLYENGAYQPEQEQSFTPALCNRLDRNTGGIVIAAKTAAALRK
ncbi:MAG: pseudouridine synthase [Ruminococcus callidus]